MWPAPKNLITLVFPIVLSLSLLHCTQANSAVHICRQPFAPNTRVVSMFQLLAMDRCNLLNSISSLEQRKEQLVQELNNVNLELESLKARYARAVNEAVPIYRLPSEILTNIFFTCQQYRKNTAKSLPFQVIVSHVSDHWRQIVLSTPLLWNNINFHIRPTRSHVQGRYLTQLEAYLKRSDRCFLDIAFYFHVADNIAPYLTLISRHSTRWRRLSIITSYEPVNDIYTLLHSAQTPHLEHLSLNIGKPQQGALSPRKEYPCILPAVLLPGAPSLSFVRLAGLALGNLHPPISKVTTLHLDGWTRHYMTHEQFKTIFDSAPEIINLSINHLWIYHPRDPLEVTTPVKLRNLRYLRIQGACYRLLSLLDIPQLHALSLHEVEDFDSYMLPAVQSLTLVCCPFDERKIKNLISSLPSITSLFVDESIPVIFSILAESETSHPWPQLHTMSVRELEWMDIPALCAMVDKRMNSDKPLKQIRLDRRSRTVLRTKHRLDWLQKLVHVECDYRETWPPGLGYEDEHDLVE